MLLGNANQSAYIFNSSVVTRTVPCQKLSVLTIFNEGETEQGMFYSEIT